jgi:hypothetical protein
MMQFVLELEAQDPRDDPSISQLHRTASLCSTVGQYSTGRLLCAVQSRTLSTDCVDSLCCVLLSAAGWL